MTRALSLTWALSLMISRWQLIVDNFLHNNFFLTTYVHDLTTFLPNIVHTLLRTQMRPFKLNQYLNTPSRVAKCMWMYMYSHINACQYLKLGMGQIKSSPWCMSTSFSHLLLKFVVWYVLEIIDIFHQFQELQCDKVLTMLYVHLLSFRIVFLNL